MMSTFPKLISKHFFLVLFLTFYFSIICFKLVSLPTPFYDWDESINAEVGREMIRNKSFVPLWQGNVWLDKPPFPFLFFGIIMKLIPFVAPEVSLRIVSLLLSVISLAFIYAVFYKATQNKLVTLVTVIVTAFTPIFLQRSQILNLDVFLLIGWLGYLLFFRNFWLSLFFLTVSVLTKSLIGFYPVIVILIYYLYIYAVKKVKLDELKKTLKKLAIHVGILLLWYILMSLIFKEAFLQQHIIETHFRRVTASIEFHFGQRTYYIDMLFQELGFFTWVSFLGFTTLIWNYFHKKLTANSLMISLFLLPWFVFLNLTKTKIFWYLYPAIPQFSFLFAYPLTLLSKHRFKLISCVLSIVLILFIFYQNFIKTNFFTTFYSKPEDHYRLALFAKDRCDSLAILVGKETREAVKTLEGLGLTISSTKQWGEHPSIVYYFDKHVDFYYDANFFANQVVVKNNLCIAINKNDLDTINLTGRSELANFGSLILY